MNQTLSAIYIYPVKSLKGIALPHARIEDYGLQYDRKWMLIDKEFMSQRNYPEMSLLQVDLLSDHLHIFHSKNKLSSLRVPLAEDKNAETVNVKIWNDQCQAQLLPQDTNEWFSNVLKVDCRLVYMPDKYRRKVDEKYANNSESTKFSDGFPYLLIGQSSLDDLNKRLTYPVPVERFRPNLVVSGFEPYAEDNWNIIQIGKSTFKVVKPCARCRVTTIDQKTAKTGKEPLKTLSGYRKRDNKILFGQNLLNLSGTEINQGDKVKLI